MANLQWVQFCHVPITEKQFIKQFGINIAKARKQASLTQDQLAWKAGIADNQIGRIERGEISASLKTMFKIAKALSIEVKELF